MVGTSSQLLHESVLILLQVVSVESEGEDLYSTIHDIFFIYYIENTL